MREKTLAIIGTGTIGASWTALALSKGMRVVATDPAPGAESRLRAYVSKVWDQLDAGTSTYDLKEAFERLEFVQDIQPHLANVDFVQENGPEREDYKTRMFCMLDQATPAHIPLASSSSGLPASTFILECSSAPERVLIGHPFNPPHLVPLVETVPHSGTSSKTVANAVEFYRMLGRNPVQLSREIPGFVVNRLQAALVHEAYSLVSRGIVSAHQIDTMVSDCLAMRWALQGPFLTKVLGGGGNGIEGFKHAVSHTGAAAEVWQRDMDAHRFEYTPESIDALVRSVESELQEVGNVDLEASRDRFLQELQRLKVGLGRG